MKTLDDVVVLDDSDWWDWQNDKMLRFPPVGGKVEGFIGSVFSPFKCTFVGVDSEGRIVVEKLDGDLYRYMTNQINLRPLDRATRKAELEKKKLIEQAKSVCFAPNSQATLTTIECLIDAGWRPTKD